MKKLLVLGGFPQMIDIVATARKMGVYTIVVDKSAESVAKRFADKSYNVSTDDTDALVRIANDEKIDGVFTGFEDFNIHVAEKLAKRLSLPFYASREQLDVVTDKKKFKNACRECGVPTVEQYTEGEALALGKYPYIIKPTDSYGSRGITVARCERELVSGVDKARQGSKTSGVIIERFIENDHGVELFYTAVNGNIRLSATADRYTAKTGKTTVPLPVAEVFPSCVREKLVAALDEKVKGMLRHLGIKNGLVLVQALTDGEDFLVYEMAYRLTGEQHYRLLLRQRGYDLGKMMIKLALGEDISEYDTDAICDTEFIYPSINYALLLKEGKIGTIKGLDRVFAIDEVISYNLTHGEGDEIRPSGDYSHMLIRINMVAENYGALCRAVRDVNNYTVALSDGGEDMILTRFKLPGGNI